MNNKPKELDELLDFYENNLCNKIFKYELSNKILLEVTFFKENLCHLLGLQHVYKNDKHYLGIKGYNKIKEKNLTLDMLKKHNLKEYDKLIIKLINFEDIYNLLLAGEFLKFYQFRCKPYTDIRADFIIYQDKKEYLLHIFLRKEQHNENVYSPISFVVRSSKDKHKEQHVKGQEYKKITNFEIIVKD